MARPPATGPAQIIDAAPFARRASPSASLAVAAKDDGRLAPGTARRHQAARSALCLPTWPSGSYRPPQLRYGRAGTRLRVGLQVKWPCAAVPKSRRTRKMVRPSPTDTAHISMRRKGTAAGAAYQALLWVTPFGARGYRLGQRASWLFPTAFRQLGRGLNLNRRSTGQNSRPRSIGQMRPGTLPRGLGIPDA